MLTSGDKPKQCNERNSVRQDSATGKMVNNYAMRLRIRQKFLSKRAINNTDTKRNFRVGKMGFGVLPGVCDFSAHTKLD